MKPKTKKGAAPKATRTRWHPHLSFDGACKAAFELYARALGGKVTFSMTYGESPMAGQVPPELHGRIIHSSLTVGDQVLTGADVLPKDYRSPQGSWVMLHVGTTAEADRIFKALAKAGRVELPIQQTFWAPRFGMVVDRFGTPWIVQCGAEAST